MLRAALPRTAPRGVVAALVPARRFASGDDKNYKVDPKFEALSMFTEGGVVNVGFRPFEEGKQGAMSFGLRTISEKKVVKDQDFNTAIRPADAMALHLLWTKSVNSEKGFEFSCETHRAKGKKMSFTKDAKTGEVTISASENGEEKGTHTVTEGDFHLAMMAAQGSLPYMLSAN